MHHQVARKKEQNRPNEPQREALGISQTEQSDLTSLQRAVGNQGLMNFVQTKLAENQPITDSRVQPKLKVGGTNDRYEQEADQVADQVMRMPIKENGQITNASNDIQRAEEDELHTAQIPSLADIIYDPLFKDAFYAYAKKEFSAENIDCIKQIDIYKSKPRRSVAISIFDSFLKVGSSNEANISGAARRGIEQTIEEYRGQKAGQSKKDKMKRNVSSMFKVFTNHQQAGEPNLFETVEAELKTNMGDTYSRFVDTQEVKDILNRHHHIMTTLRDNGLL